MLEKRTDGYHNLETVFYPVSWCDVLEIITDDKASSNKKNSGVALKTTGTATYSSKEKNLCVRAYRLLEKDYPLQPIRMHLHKIIPIGAGLGGGSADAAIALKLMNRIFSLNLAETQLLHYAALLGSDCSFFIHNKPVLAKGKGEIMQSIDLNLEKYFIVIVKPSFHISTAEAYSKVSPSIPDQSLSELIKLPVEKWKHHIKNDFEKSAFSIHNELKNIKEKLYEKGAIYASMSGSGSAMYGIFNTTKDLKRTFTDCTIWSGSLSAQLN